MGGINRNWLAGAVACALIAGCGNATSNPSSNSSGHAGAAGVNAAGATSSGGASDNAGSAGARANGGANAVAGSAGVSSSSGSASSLPLGDSPTEVCIAYAVAQCLRRDECKGAPVSLEKCLSASSGCPDVVFSDGSTRTVAGVKACAAEYPTYSCEKLNSGIEADCVTPGTRAGGQPCKFGAQCASLGCNTVRDLCGQCYAPAALGAECGAENVRCGNGLSCDSDTQRCTSTVLTTFNREGAPCSPQLFCDLGLYCSSNNVCTKYPTLGASCAESLGFCRDSYCPSDAPLTCTAPPAAGQPCAKTQSGTFVCAADAVCSFTDATHAVCLARPSAGRPCLHTINSFLTEDNVVCAAGTYCNTAGNCVAPGGAGASCDSFGECQPGLSCACPDGNTTGCDERSCVAIGFSNQGCGVPGKTCHPGLTCTGGVCQPRASQGLFDSACANN